MTRRRVYIALAIAAVITGGAIAIARAWVCDDAFISFRYAEHLVEGKGMVFNAGERVEGETNLLWTLWTALGLAIGAGAIAWTKVWGILCYVATLALLARRGWDTARDNRWAIPSAAIFGAVTISWADFATSGLETSAFTLTAVIAYALVCPSDPARPARPGLAGVAIGAAALLRPDAVVFGVVIGVWLLAGGTGMRGKAALRAALVFAAGVAVLWVPATLWRVVYYGDFVPNTYYAKSADRAWWSQGATYVWLFAERYWPLLFAFPLAALARRRAVIVLELAMSVLFTLYVARVGGDFMFARALVPIVPFLAMALERGLAGALTNRPGRHAGAIGVLAVALAFMPQPVGGRMWGVQGIVDERSFYTQEYDWWADSSDRGGAILARMFDGLPVTVAFFGSEARIIYRSRVATAIECETGLTDRTIARQPLTGRRRVGHEKHAHLDYLLARGVNFMFAENARDMIELDRFVPDIEVDLGGVKAWVIVWNPQLMAALRARGAKFIDLPTVIDGVIAVLPLLPDDVVRRTWEKLRRSYFDHVKDPAREAPFRARL